ncbi:MAG: SIS domain-containing protein [Candidatus Levybacteria bacterium]|nr:SIS domain-containing protein [Candidatus Levybacteria bacterium]
MQNVLDIEGIKKIDPRDTFASTELLVKQCKAAWEDISKLDISFDTNGIVNIVFCGMGASIYGALVTKALLGLEIAYPSEIVTDYHLPTYVDEHTLVVLTSYSGTTEEVLSCAKEAKARDAKMLILTKGGPLLEFAKENAIPSYIFDGKLNPSGVPRLGNGYTILGLIGLLNKARIINIEEREILDAITRLEEKLPEIKGQAHREFEIFQNKIPVIITAEHLSGNGQILRNQCNETAKTFSCYYVVPDLNHHLMEGLQFPKDHNLHFLFLNSQNYSSKIKKRMQLTIDVVKQNNHELHEFMTSGQSIYDDFLEVLAYGSYLTLFLSLRYDQDPAVNPWVDWFKEQLKNS